MKPALAEDAILDKVIFPCWFQPKIDGVRAGRWTGQLTGRSLDPFEGFGITEYFSDPLFKGFDGEMTLGPVPNSPDRLCSLTTGAMGKFKGVTEMADLHWWVFDYLEQPGWEYWRRYAWVAQRVAELDHPRIHLVPYTLCENLAQLVSLYEEALDNNYEGGIVRNFNAPHKEGRSDKNQQLWRMKPWQDDEMLCTGITEGDKNENEAKINSLGRTERSSAKAGKVPNGQVGSLQGTVLKDIVSNVSGKVLFPKGQTITVGSGKMKVKEAIHYFQHQDEIVGHVIKFQHLAHGVKDKPRMGGYLSHRLPQDMS